MPHLLIVEDELTIGESLQDGFHEFGYQVTWLDRGDNALETLKTHTFDLIILDLTLPKVSGLVLAKFIRDNQHTTPIIVITANDFIEERQQCRETGVDIVFGKPFELEALLDCVEGLLLAKAG